MLRALGVGEELAHTSIRFGLGRFNTEEEVDYVDRPRSSTRSSKLRELSPLCEMAQGGHRPQVASSGPRTERQERETRHGVQRQSHRALREPAQRRHASTRTIRRRRHRPGRRARLRRRDEAADQGQRRRASSRTPSSRPSAAARRSRRRRSRPSGSRARPSTRRWQIKNTQIVEELNLPPVKIHCSVLAEDAIKARDRRLQDEAREAQAMDHDGDATARRRVERSEATTMAIAGHATAAVARDQEGGRAQRGDAAQGAARRHPRRRLHGLLLPVRVGRQPSRAPTDKVLVVRGRRRARLRRPEELPLPRRLDARLRRPAMMGHGFKFENPNVKGTCGCGESVQF